MGREIDAADVLRVADDVIILNIGRFVYDGRAEVAQDHPELFHAHLGDY